jgi:hypothetical protein
MVFGWVSHRLAAEGVMDTAQSWSGASVPSASPVTIRRNRLQSRNPHGPSRASLNRTSSHTSPVTRDKSNIVGQNTRYQGVFGPR